MVHNRVLTNIHIYVAKKQSTVTIYALTYIKMHLPVSVSLATIFRALHNITVKYNSFPNCMSKTR